MKLDLVKEKDNPLLSRKRMTFEGQVEKATPSRIELKNQIAQQIKVKPECVVVRHVYTKFGSTKIKVIAHVYKTIEDLQKTEDKATIKRNTLAKKEDEGTAEQSGETPKEEKKEEAAEQPAEENKDESSEKPAEESSEPAKEEKTE